MPTQEATSAFSAQLPSVSYTFEVGVPASLGAMSVTGGTIANCTVEPTALPEGLSFDSTACALSGTPTLASPSTDYRMRVASTDGLSVSVALVIAVVESLSLTPAHATLTVPAQSTLRLTASGGVLPFRFALVSGPGSIDANGVYRTTARTGSAIVSVTDARGQRQTATLRLRSLHVAGEVTRLHAYENELYVAGHFNRTNAIAAPGILALNATDAEPDPVFDVGMREYSAARDAGFDGMHLYIVGKNLKRRIVRLNTDGSEDRGYGVDDADGFDHYPDYVFASDVGVYVSGDFTKFGTAPARSLAKLDGSGRADITFSANIGIGFDSMVAHAVAQPDGVVVAGNFSKFKGVALPHPRIAKLTSAGLLDLNFSANLGTGFDDEVRALLRVGNYLYAAGDFLHFNGHNVNGIVRLGLDGSWQGTGFDAGFASPVSVPGTYGLVALSDGFLALGIMTTYVTSAGSVPIARGVAKLRFDGTLDSAFNAKVGGLPVAAESLETAVAIGDAIYLAGTFSQFAGVAVSSVVKISSTGDLDLAFCRGVGTGFNDVVDHIFAWGGRLVLSGFFSSYRGGIANGFARFDAAGFADDGFSRSSARLNGSTISSVSRTPDSIYVSGEFTPPIVRLELTGEKDGAFVAASTPGLRLFNGTTLGSAQVSVAATGNTLYAAGYFNNFNGNTITNGIAQVNLLNGSPDTAFNSNAGTGHSLQAAGLLYSDALFTFGTFASFNGVTTGGVVRLLNTGAINPTFATNWGTGFGSQKVQTVVSVGPWLFAAGELSSYTKNGASTPLGGIAKLSKEGVFDSTFTPAFSGGQGHGFTLAASSDAVFVASNSTMYNNQPVGRVIRIGLDGALATEFSTKNLRWTHADHSVALAVVDGGNTLAVGGDLAGYGDQPVGGLVFLDSHDASLH